MNMKIGIVRSHSRYVVKDRVIGGVAGLLLGITERSGGELDAAASMTLRWLDGAHAPDAIGTILAVLQGQGSTLDHGARTSCQARARLDGRWVTASWRDGPGHPSAFGQPDFSEPGPLGGRDEPFDAAWSRLVRGGSDADGIVRAALLGLEHGYFGFPAAWRDRLEASEPFRLARARVGSAYAEGSPDATPVVRTSTTHPLRIGTVTLRSEFGRVGVTFCPGKHQQASMTGIWQRDLGTDLDAIRAWGATHLVTLVERWELSELHVPDLPEAAGSHGLRWHHFPIVDGTIPDASTDRAWSALADVLLSGLPRGESVVFHCKGGLGRAGTMAARLLLHSGASRDAEDAVARVRAARENAVETAIQERYLLRLADAMHSRTDRTA
jgi:protein-tyrosine phosphatase